MNNDVEKRIVKARNELKAQKTAMELAYSSILWPSNTPEAQWTGDVALEDHSGVVARFRARFRRSDGQTGAPYVDFAQHVNYYPTYVDYSQSIGRIVTGNDVGYVDDQNYTGYVAGAGTDYVDYYIDFVRELINNYYTLSSVNIGITVQAISMVQGNVTITRLI